MSSLEGLTFIDRVPFFRKIWLWLFATALSIEANWDKITFDVRINNKNLLNWTETLTLARHTQNNPPLDPLAVLHLNNWLFMKKGFTECYLLMGVSKWYPTVQGCYMKWLFYAHVLALASYQKSLHTCKFNIYFNVPKMLHINNGPSLLTCKLFFPTSIFFCTELLPNLIKWLILLEQSG